MENKNLSYYINKIIEDASIIIKETKDVSYEEFCDNKLLQDGVCFRIIQISESCNAIPEIDKIQNPSIPWHEIKGLRNRLVHEYGNIDYLILFNTIKQNIPELRTNLEAFLNNFNNC